tara:strand:+ start:383 stop:748 length:366 start_codon:yes stop_codon:yes gene_type:complete
VVCFAVLILFIFSTIKRETGERNLAWYNMIRHTFAGRRYSVILDARLKSSHGLCTDPARPSPTIKIAANLGQADFLEAVIHEALHASAYDLLSEHWVTTSANDIARLLLKLGFRLDAKETE